jgi:uncharacterized membrane protein YqiK
MNNPTPTPTPKNSTALELFSTEAKRLNFEKGLKALKALGEAETTQNAKNFGFMVDSTIKKGRSILALSKIEEKIKQKVFCELVGIHLSMFHKYKNLISAVETPKNDRSVEAFKDMNTQRITKNQPIKYGLLDITKWLNGDEIYLTELQAEAEAAKREKEREAAKAKAEAEAANKKAEAEADLRQKIEAEIKAEAKNDFHKIAIYPDFLGLPIEDITLTLNKYADGLMIRGNVHPDILDEALNKISKLYRQTTANFDNKIISPEQVTTDKELIKAMDKKAIKKALANNENMRVK